ncbi:hypothetical protein SASPL_123741 [Salvia splendens]|uniref:Uncharacterized protein n=1 Tax=Salvia splendens TaxID=180675 RepID=A0A8X8XQV4_SALSN|nr:hypothetical protein SASPL_123741 [Salvia splendens]
MGGVPPRGTLKEAQLKLTISWQTCTSTFKEDKSTSTGSRSSSGAGYASNCLSAGPGEQPRIGDDFPCLGIMNLQKKLLIGDDISPYKLFLRHYWVVGHLKGGVAFTTSKTSGQGGAAFTASYASSGRGGIAFTASYASGQGGAAFTASYASGRGGAAFTASYASSRGDTAFTADYASSRGGVAFTASYAFDQGRDSYASGGLILEIYGGNCSKKTSTPGTCRNTTSSPGSGRNTPSTARGCWNTNAARVNPAIAIGKGLRGCLWSSALAMCERSIDWGRQNERRDEDDGGF